MTDRLGFRVEFHALVWTLHFLAEAAYDMTLQKVSKNTEACATFAGYLPSLPMSVLVHAGIYTYSQTSTLSFHSYDVKTHWVIFWETEYTPFPSSANAVLTRLQVGLPVCSSACLFARLSYTVTLPSEPRCQ